MDVISLETLKGCCLDGVDWNASTNQIAVVGEKQIYICTLRSMAGKEDGIARYQLVIPGLAESTRILKARWSPLHQPVTINGRCEGYPILAVWLSDGRLQFWAECSTSKSVLHRWSLLYEHQKPVVQFEWIQYDQLVLAYADSFGSLAVVQLRPEGLINLSLVKFAEDTDNLLITRLSPFVYDNGFSLALVRGKGELVILRLSVGMQLLSCVKVLDDPFPGLVHLAWIDPQSLLVVKYNTVLRVALSGEQFSMMQQSFPWIRGGFSCGSLVDGSLFLGDFDGQLHKYNLPTSQLESIGNNTDEEKTEHETVANDDDNDGEEEEGEEEGGSSSSGKKMLAIRASGSGQTILTLLQSKASGESHLELLIQEPHGPVNLKDPLSDQKLWEIVKSHSHSQLVEMIKQQIMSNPGLEVLCRCLQLLMAISGDNDELRRTVERRFYRKLGEDMARAKEIDGDGKAAAVWRVFASSAGDASGFAVANNLPMDACPACQQPVLFTDFCQAKCTAGHLFPRCMATFEPVDILSADYEQCNECQRVVKPGKLQHCCYCDGGLISFRTI